MTVQITRLYQGNEYLLNLVADDVFDQPIKQEHLAALLQTKNHFLFVAISNGIVIGQAKAMIHHHPDKPSELYIDNLGVTPSYQRQGIATQLLKEMMELSMKMGCEVVWVTTELDNEPAKALYKSLGLKEQKVVLLDAQLS